MTYRDFPPDPRLTGAVLSVWQMSADPARGADEHRFLPERSVRLTFSVGPSFLGALPGGRLDPMPGAFLLGPGLEPLRVVSHGARTLGVDLFPWGARHLFGWDPGRRTLDATDLHPRLSREVCALLSLNEWDAARERVEHGLIGLLGQRAREPGVAVAAATRLYRSHGAARVSLLADEFELSPRQLERHFVREVGLPAKTLGRLIRFDEAQRRLRDRPGESLAGLAFELGFADQAHLSREFRALAQMTPRSFARMARQLRGHFGPDERPT